MNMEHITKEQLDGQVASQSALVYVPLSLTLALLFWMAATLLGDYPNVARIGGAVWIGLLSLIVSMPIVTSYFKKRARLLATL
jgi:hypothetical protein